MQGGDSLFFHFTFNRINISIKIINTTIFLN